MQTHGGFPCANPYFTMHMLGSLVFHTLRALICLKTENKNSVLQRIRSRARLWLPRYLLRLRNGLQAHCRSNPCLLQYRYANYRCRAPNHPELPIPMKCGCLLLPAPGTVTDLRCRTSRINKRPCYKTGAIKSERSDCSGASVFVIIDRVKWIIQQTGYIYCLIKNKPDADSLKTLIKSIGFYDN